MNLLYSEAMPPRPSTPVAALVGLTAAAIAVGLRLTISAGAGGEQAIFSYPAVILATLLFGRRAGAVAAAITFVTLWYYVVPPVHSFAIASAAGAISLGTYALVTAALIWSLGAMRDMLARYNALVRVLERTLERRTAERNRLWERSQELVAVIDDDDFIELANPALRTRVGERLHPGVPTRFTALLDQTERAAFGTARAELAAGSAAAAFETTLGTDDDISVVSWTMVRDGSSRFLVGRDVTAERDCTEQLQQSRKMEMVGQMTGGMAHDFANLLSPISMALEQLERRHTQDQRTLAMIRMANDSTARAGQLVRRMLRFARPGAPTPSRVPLRQLIDGVAPLLKQVVGERRFELSLADDLPDVRVDASEFDMAMLNLAVNARDATSRYGAIRLSAERGPDGRAIITFADDGNGMSAETLRHATEPFYSTKGDGGGTGLGLPMVRSFAVAAGGSMSLDSRAGYGAAIRIVLPAEPQRG